MKIILLIVIGAFVCCISVLAAASPSQPGSGTAAESSPDAAQLYSQNCAKCHGKDGRASGVKAKLGGVRNLTDPEWQGRVSDERIFNSINNGKGKMPAFSKKLSEADVDSLVNYVRSLKK